jgi:hypothetical protein
MAVGYSTVFGSGDWTGIEGKGDYDAIIVNYDNNGNVLWKKNFGGSKVDRFQSVTTASNSVVAVGFSTAFGDGDWTGITGKGFRDSIVVKYELPTNTQDYYSYVATSMDKLGGSGNDTYTSVTTVSDGIVAVGYSAATSFGNGDWTGIVGKGGEDAIIIKYDNNGNVMWKKNFGGASTDRYMSVTAVSDGIVAVGFSNGVSFNSGDWMGIARKGGNQDAIIVKYDNNGNVMWKKNFGGSGTDAYNSVTAVSDGIVAVGFSTTDSFASGDWTGVVGKGGFNAIIIKYDNGGNVMWKKNFGGFGDDIYSSVTAVSDGIVAVGNSNMVSFGNGDWAGIAGKGNMDAIIVKYDNSGNVVWKKNFGGSSSDSFYSVTTVSGGVVAVGHSHMSSFNNGDWAGIAHKGSSSAIIVKYDNNGNIMWKNNFGGGLYVGHSDFLSVTTVSDGVVVVGESSANSFGVGDLNNIFGKGGTGDAIIVKYDNHGNVMWKNNFGGSGSDVYLSVTTVSNNVVAVGYSSVFDNRDWEGIIGNGGNDAIIVKYELPSIHLSINATADSNSMISPSGNMTLQPGDSQTYLFYANTGYHISSVTVNGEALNQTQIDSGEYTFSYILNSHTIHIESVRNPDYYIKVTYNNRFNTSSNTYKIDNVGAYAGEDKTIYFEPPQGKFIFEVIVNGKTLTYDEKNRGHYTFKNVNTNDHEIFISYGPEGGIRAYDMYRDNIIKIPVIGIETAWDEIQVIHIPSDMVLAMSYIIAAGGLIDFIEEPMRSIALEVAALYVPFVNYLSITLFAINSAYYISAALLMNDVNNNVENGIVLTIKAQHSVGLFKLVYDFSVVPQ